MFLFRPSVPPSLFPSVATAVNVIAGATSGCRTPVLVSTASPDILLAAQEHWNAVFSQSRRNLRCTVCSLSAGSLCHRR